MRPRSIPNERVPMAELPPWDRFQNFVGIISKVSKEEARDEADKESKKTKSAIQGRAIKKI